MRRIGLPRLLARLTGRSTSPDTARGDASARTAAVARYWDTEAANYDRNIAWVDRRLIGDGRRWVCSRASGRTLEIAVGTGRNLALYPPDMDVTGIDVSPRMVAVAREKADRLHRSGTRTGPVRLQVADAAALPFADESFDTVTSTLSMCAVPDLGRTLAEVQRVLRPGGRLVLLDHVRPSFAPLRWALRGVQAGVDLFRPDSGEQFLRRPAEWLAPRGLQVDESERSLGGVIERLRAHRPG